MNAMESAQLRFGISAAAAAAAMIEWTRRLLASVLLPLMLTWCGMFGERA